jgi:hypothetical protein
LLTLHGFSLLISGGTMSLKLKKNVIYKNN